MRNPPLHPNTPDSTTTVSPQPRLDAAIATALLVLGMYLPTSAGGATMTFAPAYFCSTLLLLCLILRRGRVPSLPLAITTLMIVPLLIFFTFTTGFNRATLGEIAQYTTLALLYMTTIRSIRYPASFRRVFVVVNLVNIFLGISILVGFEPVKALLMNYYSQFYSELLPMMFLFRKPVLTFGTHSIAGFFLYLFFYVNWQTYGHTRSRLFLAFAMCYLMLTLALLSVTGLLLGAFGMFQVLHYSWASVKHRGLVAFGLLALAIPVLAYQWDSVARFGPDIVRGAGEILGSPTNGLLGRLSPTGTMYGVFQYLIEHPFSPVGLAHDENLLIADMGVLDYLVRGSVVLLVWMYGGLFLFLRRNLLEKKDLFFLLGVIVAFELGYSVLLYARMPFLLAFFVIYLNTLRRGRNEPDAVSATA